MKIVLISCIAPAADNIRGTSALPYHLLIERPSDVEVVVYTFNYNNLPAEKIAKVEAELNVKIHLLHFPAWMAWIISSTLGLIIRAFLPLPVLSYLKLPQHIVAEIKKQHPDAIWIFGEELTKISQQFKDFKQIHTGPDCEALYYKRLLECRHISRIKQMRGMIMFGKYKRLARRVNSYEKIHIVGEADAKYLRSLNPKAEAHFIRHPHYNYSNKKTIKFSSPKVKLLLAGRNDLYMAGCAEEVVDLLAKHSELAQHYSFTFLGKGWELEAKRLTAAGWECEHITFVEHYFEELTNHDIQITPISIGTGTKGKVLDALANGLMVIGTPTAMENIATVNGESCIEYSSTDNLLAVLRDIPSNIAKYEAIACNGRIAVLSEHSRSLTSDQLFHLLKI